MADVASPPAAAAAAASVPEASSSSTSSALTAPAPPPTPVAPSMPAKTLSWASLAKQNLPVQQPAAPASKAATSSGKQASNKRPSGPSPLGAGKAAGGTSSTKASGGGSKANGGSQRSTAGGAGAAASVKDSDDHPFTTVTTSRSASSRSVDWRRKDENGAGQPKARRVEKEKGEKHTHRHGEKKSLPPKEGGKTGPSPAKGGNKKSADAASAAAASSSTTAMSKPISEADEITTAEPIRKNDFASPEPTTTPARAAPAAESSTVAETPAAATVTKAPAAAVPTAVSSSVKVTMEEPKAASEEIAVETATSTPGTPAPPPAPRPIAKPPAVNVWKVRASSSGLTTTPAKPLKGFPTASVAAALAKAAKAESIPTPSSSPPASTTSLFTPSNSSATTASPPSTLPATSTTPSLADEAWPEPSFAAAPVTTSSKASASAAEGDEAGKSAAESAISKTKKEKKKWVAISPAELQASVDQANAASGKGKKMAKRSTDDAASAASRTAPMKKSVGEGSTTSQPSNASANGTTALTKKAKKAAAAALASTQGNGSPYPPATLIQHHSPHLDHFQPPPSAYNPHLADMPILPISHLTSAEELVMPQHFDLTAGLPSAGPLSAMDGSLDADHVEISKDVEMSLLKKSGGRASLGGRVEGNGVPADIAGLLLKDHEVNSLGSSAPPPSTSTAMDRTRSAPLSGAIPIRAPPSNGLNVQSSVFQPANAGAKSPRGSAPTMRGGTSSASASGGRGGSQSGRSPGTSYAGRPNPFAGPYQQASGQPASYDGRVPYLSPPPLGAGGLPSSPRASFGSYPKDSHVPRLSPRQALGSFGSFPLPQPPQPQPFGQASQAVAGVSTLGLSSGLSGNGTPYGAYHAPPPMPLPVTIPAVPLEPLRFYLLGQLEYYFGAHNLVKDFFLRKSMDSLGFVDISTIAAFNRVKTLTLDLALVREVLLLSELVEVREQKVRLINRGWQQWLLPDAPASDIKEDTGSPAAHKTDLAKDALDESPASVAKPALKPNPADGEKAQETKPSAVESIAPAVDAAAVPEQATPTDQKPLQS